MTTPYGDAVNPDGTMREMLSEIVGIIVVLVGLAMVAWGAFAIDWRVGLIVVGTYLIVGGFALGMSR